MDDHASEKYNFSDGSSLKSKNDARSLSKINFVPDWSTVGALDDHVPEKLKIPDGSFSEVEKYVELFVKINFVTD